MFFLLLPLLFIPGILIYALGMYFLVWPDVKELVETIKDESVFKAILSWDMFFLLLKVLGVAAVAAIINLAIIFFMFKWVFDMLCGSATIQLILALGPIIVEIVGYVLSVIGIGIPIVGIGMFFEIFSLICDLMAGDMMSFALGIAGLIPVAGIFPGLGKTFKKGSNFISMVF